MGLTSSHTLIQFVQPNQSFLNEQSEFSSVYLPIRAMLIGPVKDLWSIRPYLLASFTSLSDILTAVTIPILQRLLLHLCTNLYLFLGNIQFKIAFSLWESRGTDLFREKSKNMPCNLPLRYFL